MAVVALLTALHWQFGLFVGYEASFDPLDVILNLLMIRSDINGVMWSMTVECAATPLILLSVWLFRTHGERPLWGLIAVLLALSSWRPYVHQRWRSPPHHGNSDSMLGSGDSNCRTTI
jgi:peptidoglycan/LPS O-acetylase OafA/YrhL